MEFKEIYEDIRGKVWVFTWKEKDYLLIFTKAGFMRGGEIHLGKQWNIFLEGKVTWIQGDKQIDILAPAFIEVPAHIPHMMLAIEDTLMLEWRELPKEEPTQYYFPFREKIEKHNMVI